MADKLLIKYSSNNSGGSWWLKDDDWKNLEGKGWSIEWKEGGFLGALATYASKHFTTMREALEEFEEITGQNVSDEGCNCCGPPHNFSVENSKE